MARVCVLTIRNNGDTQKWMVYNGKSESCLNECFRGTPILGNPQVGI